MTLATEKEKIAHLLRRFGLGASEAELAYYGKNGLMGAIDLLLDFSSTNWQFDVDPQAFANQQGVVNIRVYQALWYTRMMATQRPLEEKLTLFWHSHFATSAQKVERGAVMYKQIELLRRNCLGKFEDLLLAVSKDPAMLYWLDNQENVKGKPNENFAREVMELFTLGIGHYTEKDIQEAARAFTGWGYGIGRRLNNDSPRGPERFIFSPERHDDGEKTVFGQTGNYNGDDIVRMLCEKPETAKRITRKMWEFFAYLKPDEALISSLASKFISSGLDLKVLVRAIMESPEFYSEKSMRTQVKNPIDFAVSTTRQLGIGGITMQRIRDGQQNGARDEKTGLNPLLVRSLAPSFALMQTTKSMGMELMWPPDVSGWPLGNEWITTATMLERVKWAEKLFVGSTQPGGQAANVGGGLGGGRVAAAGYQPMALFEADPSPAGIARVMLSIFDVSLPASKVKVLEDAVAHAMPGRMTPVAAGDAARAVCKLIFGSPEFQFG